MTEVESYDYIRYADGTKDRIMCYHCNKLLDGVRLIDNLYNSGNAIFCTDECLQDYVNEQITEYLEKRNES